MTLGESDFGPGFYTFLATPQGLAEAKFRAKQKASENASEGVVFVYRISRVVYDYLHRLDLSPSSPEAYRWGYVVDAYRQGGRDEYVEHHDVVIGPLAVKRLRANEWKSKQPDQYNFRTSTAVADLQLITIIPAN